MKHASCGLQNQEGSHPQQDSLATCLGSNITSPSSWTTWSSTGTHPLRVVAARGMEQGALSDKVLLVLEVAHLLVKMPSFQVVADAGELLVLPFNLSDDGASVSFKLGMSLVVAVVAFDLSRGGEVHRMDRHSQGKEGSSITL
jgi:hypothetical protein